MGRRSQLTLDLLLSARGVPLDGRQQAVIATAGSVIHSTLLAVPVAKFGLNGNLGAELQRSEAETYPMKTFLSDQHIRHSPELEFSRGRLVEPFERPERIDMIVKRLKDVMPGTIEHPASFGMVPVEAVHAGDYLSFLKTCWTDWHSSGRAGDAIAGCWPTRRMDSGKIPVDIGGRMGHYGMATDTSICAGTWEAALSSKDVALTATRTVLDGERAAFGLCRPPGHHAAFDQYCGYCFLNNAGISAQFARDAGVARVAILDVDFHHGNGTQQLFYERDDVYFASIHGDPLRVFPYFLGHEDETGSGAGEGFNRNYVFGPGTPYAPWRRALVSALDCIADFGAELLIVSLGVDTFKDDPISFFTLENDDFTDMGTLLASARLPTVFLMEGGYAIADVGINVGNVLTGFEAGSISHA